MSESAGSQRRYSSRQFKLFRRTELTVPVVDQNIETAPAGRDQQIFAAVFVNVISQDEVSRLRELDYFRRGKKRWRQLALRGAIVDFQILRDERIDVASLHGQYAAA